MSFLKRYKNLLLFLGIIVLAAAGYFFFIGGGDNGGSQLSAQSADGTAGGNAQQSELVSLLLGLQSIQLDSSLFEDPAFRSLQDFSTELSSQPVGRSNPFAPLSAGAGSAAEGAATSEQ